MKAIIFDLDDTLYNQIQPFERGVRQFLEIPDELMEPLYIAFRYRADEVFEESVSGEMSMKDMYTYRMKAAFADIGMRVSSETALEIQQVYAYNQEHLELTEGAQELFAFCKEKNLKIGLITNGPHLHQLKKIQSLKLSQWIPENLIIISGQVGITKPNIEIFRLMEGRLHLSSEDLVYVGDSYENDVIGAKAAGWKVIWYNHRERLVENQVLTPDKTVKDLVSIKEWIASDFLE